MSKRMDKPAYQPKLKPIVAEIRRQIAQEQWWAERARLAAQGYKVAPRGWA